MIDDAQHAPAAPQPAATRDGVPLTPLAGGFLPPYTERLPLLVGLPAPSPEAMATAMAAAAGATAQETPGRAETSIDEPDNADSDDSINAETDAPSDGRAAAALEATKVMDAWSAPFGDPEETHSTVEDRRIEGPHGPVPLRIYRPEPGWVAPVPSPDDDGRRQLEIGRASCRERV